jgi:hypothetical protein
MSWKDFRELSEREYVDARRPSTRRNFDNTLDAFEDLVRPTRLDAINERTISRFSALLRKEPGRRTGHGMMESTVEERNWLFELTLAARRANSPGPSARRLRSRGHCARIRLILA